MLAKPSFYLDGTLVEHEVCISPPLLEYNFQRSSARRRQRNLVGCGESSVAADCLAWWSRLSPVYQRERGRRQECPVFHRTGSHWNHPASRCTSRHASIIPAFTPTGIARNDERSDIQMAGQLGGCTACHSCIVVHGHWRYARAEVVTGYHSSYVCI